MLQFVKRVFVINSNNLWLYECLIKFFKFGKYKKDNIYVKVNMIIQLFFIKLDVKEICNNVK